MASLTTECNQTTQQLLLSQKKCEHLQKLIDDMLFVGEPSTILVSFRLFFLSTLSPPPYSLHLLISPLYQTCINKKIFTSSHSHHIFFLFLSLICGGALANFFPYLMFSINLLMKNWCNMSSIPPHLFLVLNTHLSFQLFGNGLKIPMLQRLKENQKIMCVDTSCEMLPKN